MDRTSAFVPLAIGKASRSNGLREACRVSTALDKLTRESVRRAREAGHSWTQIGEALGVTKQTAWERYSGED